VWREDLCLYCNLKRPGKQKKKEEKKKKTKKEGGVSPPRGRKGVGALSEGNVILLPDRKSGSIERKGGKGLLGRKRGVFEGREKRRSIAGKKLARRKKT